MRVIVKILLFPITLMVTVFVAISTFLLERFTGLFNIISGILFLGALASLVQYLFGWPFGEALSAYGLQSTITIGAFSFLLSPYGLPTLAAWTLSKLDNLNCVIKSI